MDLLLDTDIGSDIDDALALALVVGSPELQLAGVTTVYGDTRLRARLARRYLSLTVAGARIPVAAGAETTLSGRDVWWAGHEGALFADLQQEQVDEDAVGLLCRSVAARPGSLDVLAIGPLTNIALALEQDPAFATNVRRLVIMGGDFGEHRAAEHNFASDVTATQRVFASAAEIVVGGLDLTRTVRLGVEDVEALERSGRLGEVLGSQIRSWWQFTDEQGNHPHDPMIALSSARPDLFTRVRCRVRIDDDGRSWDTADGDGRVVVLGSAQPDAIRRELVARIRAAADHSTG